MSGVALADFAGGVDEGALQGRPVDGVLADLPAGNLDEFAANIGRGHPAGAAAVATVASGQPVVAGRGGTGAVVGPAEHVGAGGVEFDAAVDATDLADPQVGFHAGELLAVPAVGVAEFGAQVGQFGQSMGDEFAGPVAKCAGDGGSEDDGGDVGDGPGSCGGFE